MLLEFDIHIGIYKMGSICKSENNNQCYSIYSIQVNIPDFSKQNNLGRKISYWIWKNYFPGKKNFNRFYKFQPTASLAISLVNADISL